MTIPIRKFDVFSSYVVVQPGETIQWICESQVPSATVQSGSWALTKPSYSGITPTTPQQAQVSSSAAAGNTAPFSSTPQGPNPTQQVIVAGWAGAVCSSPSVLAGQYIYWANDTGTSYTIQPQNSTAPWPFQSRLIRVLPNSVTVLPTLPGATATDYPEVVVPACPNNTNPVIKIRSSMQKK